MITLEAPFYSPRMRESDYMPLIELALREDLGESGDVTSQAVVPGQRGRATLWSKEPGVLAGEKVFEAVFLRIDPSLDVAFLSHDGAAISEGEKIASVTGDALALLSAERIALNFISFLSGIATTTRSLVESAAAAGRAVVLDTRKTLPGYRALSKYAVAVGGGRNHRQGLYDMVLVKDNHVDSAGSISAALARVRAKWGTRFTVEVECRTLPEVEEALGAGADIIMLDNMDLERMREAVRLVGAKVKVEASGNMTRERIGPVSATGVDFISVGMLTHSVRSHDFSLKVSL